MSHLFQNRCNMKPLYCKTHMEKGMINVLSKTCLNEECLKQPSFNFEGETEALYCKTHMEKDMINVVSKTCLNKECLKQPCYNFEGEKKGIYCDIHRLDNMIDIKHKKCLQENCDKQPCYNFEGEKKGIYCDIHRLDNMIDIKHKTCIFKDCKTRPNYNYEGKKTGLYCSIHQLNNMIDVINKNCIFKDCKTRSSYNYEGEKTPLYCLTHKLYNMINIHNKTCLNNCGIQIRNLKYEGYCLRCYASMFPDKPLARNIKTKERSVVEFIKANYPNYDWVFDKRIREGTSLRRPDVLLNLENQVLIIEIDENQHENYDCSCNNRRLMELSQDVNHKPMIFIRFNPDKYFDKDNKNIASCWSITKATGLLKISNKNKWNDRLVELKYWIDYWIQNNTEKTIEIVELFYDQNLI